MYHPLRKQISEFKFLFGGYPDFVYSKNNIHYGGIPVFVYHTINPEIFEAHLLFLAENGYKTLSINDFLDILKNKKSLDNRYVLLTIDDARSSVWRYAFPLLKTYNMKATLFIIPGLTEDSAACRGNLENVWNKTSTLQQIKEIDLNDDTICNWNEIVAMYSSGLINIESHTLFHRENFCKSRIVDFVTTKSSFLPFNFTASPYLGYSDISCSLKPEKYLGLPLFEAVPLMSAGPKLVIPSGFIENCRDIFNNLNDSSGEKWRNEIKNLISKTSFPVEPQSTEDVREDLSKARDIIRNKLDKDAGNHLCLPWTIGNQGTIDILNELEIQSCFWGALPGGNNYPGDDPFHISRIKNDFIYRLPGDQRKSLFAIYKYKISRRLSGEKYF